ncbi:MAG: hypothetical protein IKW19_05780 [Akkermansia sp.]|nr:hypothetical protein [Akkermansia sp.]
MRNQSNRTDAYDIIKQGAVTTDARYILVGPETVQYYHTNGELLQPSPEDIIAIREGLAASLDKGRVQGFRKRAFDLQQWRAYRFAQLPQTEKAVRYILAAAKEAGNGVLLTSAQGDVYLLSQTALDAGKVKQKALAPYQLSHRQESYFDSILHRDDGVSLLSEIKGGQPQKTYQTNSTEINLLIA